MHEHRLDRLAGSPTTSGLGTEAGGRVPAQDRRGTRGERRGREPVDRSGARWWAGQAQAQTTLRACPEAVRRATRPLAPCARARSRVLRFPRTGLDPRTSGRRYPQGVRCLVEPAAHRTDLGQDRLDSAEAPPTRSAARRAGHRAVAHREMPALKKGPSTTGRASGSSTSRASIRCPQ